ncbi:hypothetical protein [Aquimarina sp. AU474]|uniref:hypothetical protein n=1 Tax=Aquimarina sp. AU474 TaxID=2108529 RepID=UPI000D6955CB|nr:hypothetical protein [Aquimarina sp. AU474]
MNRIIILTVLILSSITSFGQEEYDEGKQIEKINTILSSSIGKTKYRFSISGDDLVVSSNGSQIFPISKISTKKIKFKKKGEVKFNGRKGISYHVYLNPNEKGLFVYNSIFKKQKKFLVFFFSHEKTEVAEELKKVIIDVINKH